jgi:hypothetical protein
MSDDYFDERRAARALLSERFDLVKQFLPTKEFSGHFPHLVDSDYHILRSIGFSDLPGFIRGPRIEIFRFKAGRPAGIGNGKG